jgi:dTDP-4-amino-4,6-dideoxygalactose transaminase
LNSRLDELQAAVLRVKLPYLDQENARRREIAQRYTEALRNTGLILPGCSPEVTHVYHQYVVRTPRRDALQKHLRQSGIHTLIHYPVPVHLQPAYQGRLAIAQCLTRTEDLAKEILSFPMYPELSWDQVDAVIHRSISADFLKQSASGRH